MDAQESLTVEIRHYGPESTAADAIEGRIPNTWAVLVKRGGGLSFLARVSDEDLKGLWLFREVPIRWEDGVEMMLQYRRASSRVLHFMLLGEGEGGRRRLLSGLGHGAFDSFSIGDWRSKLVKGEAK